MANDSAFGLHSCVLYDERAERHACCVHVEENEGREEAAREMSEGAFQFELHEVKTPLALCHAVIHARHFFALIRDETARIAVYLYSFYDQRIHEISSVANA